jgi:hypothetical protein
MQRRDTDARPPRRTPPGPVPVAAPAAGVAGFGQDGRYGRSLVYSGMFGLLIASIGMAMVGRRRRDW